MNLHHSFSVLLLQQEEAGSSFTNTETTTVKVGAVLVALFSLLLCPYLDLGIKCCLRWYKLSVIVPCTATMVHTVCACVRAWYACVADDLVVGLIMEVHASALDWFKDCALFMHGSIFKGDCRTSWSTVTASCVWQGIFSVRFGFKCKVPVHRPSLELAGGEQVQPILTC